MPLPNTPLVENLANQIDKEIKTFLKNENFLYMDASPANLTMLNDKLKEHFHTDGIEATYSTVPWERNRVNISIADSYVLTRIKAINESEYQRITIWMQINGYAVPPIEADAYMHLTGQSSMAAASCLQTYDGSEDSCKTDMAGAILRAKRDRQQFIRDHLTTGDVPAPVPADSGLTIHDDRPAPGKYLLDMKKDKPVQTSDLTVHSGSTDVSWDKISSPVYIPPAKNVKASNDGLTIY